MAIRKNYYLDLAADFSTPKSVDSATSERLLALGEQYCKQKEGSLPEINRWYTLKQIEQENRDWWPTHCEALRQKRDDILNGEYREDLVYHCQDGPYNGLTEQGEREKHWWALISQPGVTMTWPIVMFSGEHVWFEWACMDNETHETTAKGSVSWVRRGHRGGCYYKGEQLTFYRDVYAPEALLTPQDAASFQRGGAK